MLKSALPMRKMEPRRGLGRLVWNYDTTRGKNIVSWTKIRKMN